MAIHQASALLADLRVEILGVSNLAWMKIPAGMPDTLLIPLTLSPKTFVHTLKESVP